jgi:hypothetical protein
MLYIEINIKLDTETVRTLRYSKVYSGVSVSSKSKRLA